MNSSPYLINPNKLTVPQIMWLVCLLLVPIIITMSLFFGIGILVNIFFAVAFCILLEYGYLFFTSQPKKALKTCLDGSNTISAILFGLSLPPFMPFWIILLGCVFIIIITKQIYGGLGNNIFNPAMAGYIFVLISFPSYVTIWPIVHLDSSLIIGLADSFLNFFNSFNQVSLDALTGSTPLNDINLDITKVNQVTLNQTIWFVINIVALLCGLLLLKMKIISWHLPFSFLGTFVLIILLYLAIYDLNFNFFWLELFSGATMLAAFFIITDPVTAATSNQARIAQGIFFAIFLFSIRLFSNQYPDGIAFAIILCNLINPLLDKIFTPKRYGY